MTAKSSKPVVKASDWVATGVGLLYSDDSFTVAKKSADLNQAVYVITAKKAGTPKGPFHVENGGVSWGLRLYNYELNQSTKA